MTEGSTLRDLLEWTVAIVFCYAGVAAITLFFNWLWKIKLNLMMLVGIIVIVGSFFIWLADFEIKHKVDFTKGEGT